MSLNLFFFKNNRWWVFILLVGLISCQQPQLDSYSEQTFARLDGIRNNEIQAILDHFEGLAQSAESITEDEVMVGFFHHANLDDFKGFSLQESQALDTRFVFQYGSFYDVLFVARSGYIFHSIKQEEDHHTNLFSGPLSETDLARTLRENPEASFVDFQPYGPSGEPAAFFIAPVFKDKIAVGWFVLQYGSNELNAMLAGQSGFGHTGEVYLVNKDKLMLSDSRFVNESSILSVYSNTEPVHLAFRESSGHTFSSDYRGIDVFSSYGVLNFKGTTWALMVEVDCDEVINEYYLENHSELAGEIAAFANKFSREQTSEKKIHQTCQSDDRVDISEIKRISSGEVCWTPGVGPCTSLIGFYPDRFGYMMHLGPTDAAYIDNPLTRIFLGTRKTNLVKNLIQRIGRFDVVENELSALKFVIVATHTNSLDGILKTLLGRGISLSQICFIYNPNADYANVSFNQGNDEIIVEWFNLTSRKTTRLLVTDGIPDIASYIDLD